MRSSARGLSRSALAIVAALALVQTGCGRKAQSAEVPASELLASIRESSAPLILDVRSPEEFARGHVPGAKNIGIDQLAQRLAEISEHLDEEVVVYCERGPRAERASALLAGAGFTAVRRLEGDMSGWRAAGLPTSP
jgi:rhodanese-related sulfurtransferase